MSKKLLLILVCCLFATAGCNVIYKQNIQQGNAIEQDKLDQLKLGMTMNQVAFLLGTPAVRDPFHQNRWDYYHSFSIRGKKAATRLVTLRFENAILSEMTGVDFDNPDAVVRAEDKNSSNQPASEPIAPAQAAEPLINAIEQPTSQDTSLNPESEAVREAAETAIEVTAMDSVELESLESANEQSVPVADNEPDLWLIQLGAFESAQNAKNLLNRMATEGFTGSVTHQEVAHLGSRYLVRSEGFESRELAQQQLEVLNSVLKIDAFLIPPSN